MSPIVELARAKVNLALHVTGQRADGYHLLDSLVVFPEIGDRIEVEAAKTLSLTIDGPFAGELGAGGDNLVLRAAERLCPQGRGAAIHLTKSLPVASGIGGGSADAAAALRALSRLWELDVDPELALSLGADVPVCLVSQSQWMRGIGEVLEPAKGLPALWLVLVNPRVSVSTPMIFERLARRDNPAMTAMPQAAPSDWIDWLREQRNDLQEPAIATAPVVEDVLDALRRQAGCDLARMSGSGATCLGVFREAEAAIAGRQSIDEAHPEWWCVAAPVHR